jgi:diaminopimelate epimerase
MQALGNDFVMIDVRANELCREFIPTICNRNYGIGCDTLVLYKQQDSEIFADFFNPDGSEAEICGNAARCIGLLMKKQNGVLQFTLRTKKKSYPIQVDKDICVNMGEPSFDPEEIGVPENVTSEFMLKKLNLPNDVYHASCISVGNPHLVLFCNNILDEGKMKSLGTRLENNSLFKNKINVSFAHVTEKGEIDLTVFERGAGLTLACGSGACAAAAVAYIDHIILSKKILVKQRGGKLFILIDDNLNISKIGPASHVFYGWIEL